MRKYKTVKIEEEKLSKVICDFCKEEIDKNLVEYEGFGKVQIGFGYGSDYDGAVYTGDICDDCFGKFFKDKLIENRYL